MRLNTEGENHPVSLAADAIAVDLKERITGWIVCDNGMWVFLPNEDAN